ncbi:TetR/AcrR family transcriptional regulator, partial [Actinomadura adrarensis]
DGPALEAMRRLIAAMVSVGDRILFLWGDPRVLEEYGPPTAEDGECDVDELFADDPTLALIERGQAEGVFDPESDPHWIRQVLWAMVFTGIEEAGRGLLPRHGVAATVIRTFENGVTAK